MCFARHQTQNDAVNSRQNPDLDAATRQPSPHPGAPVDWAVLGNDLVDVVGRIDEDHNQVVVLSGYTDFGREAGPDPGTELAAEGMMGRSELVAGSTQEGSDLTEAVAVDRN